MRKPVIALTMGDPAGIGPEIAVRAASDPVMQDIAEIVLYGSINILEHAEKLLSGTNTRLTIKETSDICFEDVPIGQVDAACGLAARDSVIAATNDALAGEVDAIVTAPMNKASVNKAGVSFSGHTELIADMCGVTDYAMMQSAEELRVAFVTTHIALKEVANAVTIDRICQVADLLFNAVKAEGIDKPRIAVAAINPHAGENGYMGEEDEKIVKPAISMLLEKGMDLEGPFPPDTLFIESIRTQFDGILSMYHDQGHIPFKMLAFDRGVNSTLGLPIIRTSVDHGTAFEIAWQGKADTGSLYAAIKLAAKRAQAKTT